MKATDLTGWFKPRMLPLVVASSVLFAVAAPTAYHVQTRRVWVQDARTAAKRVAQHVRETVQQRPRLWRYDSAKLNEWLTTEGHDRLAAWVVRDEHGEVLIKGRGPGGSWSAGLVWGHAAVEVAGRVVGHVWAGVDTRGVWDGTLTLGLVFALLATLFGLVLYQLPMRAVSVAEGRVKELMEELALTLPEEERKRIARELHDGAGQALTAARLHLTTLKRGAADPSALQLIVNQVDDALDEVRRSTTALLPPALQDLGLRGALERHCHAYGEATGLVVSCEVNLVEPLDDRTSTACYRIVQEALNNVAKHAGATEATVGLNAEEGGIRLTVVDNGHGVEPGARVGWGVSSMQERARALGGHLSFTTDDGGGARLEVFIPCAPGACANRKGEA